MGGSTGKGGGKSGGAGGNKGGAKGKDGGKDVVVVGVGQFSLIESDYLKVKSAIDNATNTMDPVVGKTVYTMLLDCVTLNTLLASVALGWSQNCKIKKKGKQKGKGGKKGGT